MTTQELIVERVQHLPDYMHAQVIDYLDFLLSKYLNESQETDMSPEHKTILMERYEKYKNNSDSGDTWENVKQRLMKKYAV